MSKTPPPTLSRREQQIMDIVYARGEASAAEIHADLPDPPSYSAVRALLAILLDTGHLKHRSEKGRYIYAPTRRRSQAGRSAMRRVIDTFFDGSLEKAVAAHLAAPAANLSPEELERLSDLIQQAKNKGKQP